jgi:hypothetical protein
MKRQMVIEKVEQALQCAEQSYAIGKGGASFAAFDAAKNEEIKSAIRLYMKSWIEAPLRTALKELKEGAERVVKPRR